MIARTTSDGRLRCEVSLRRQRRGVASDVAMRILFDSRPLLTWSRLRLTNSNGEFAGLRELASSTEVLNLVAERNDGGEPFGISVLCCNGGMALRASEDFVMDWCWPRETLGIAGSFGGHHELRKGKLPGVEWGEEPLLATYRYGLGALLAENSRGWWFLAAERPADIPCNNLARPLARFVEWEPPREPKNDVSGFAPIDGHDLVYPFLYPRHLHSAKREWPWCAAEGTETRRKALDAIREPLRKGEALYCLRGEVGEYLLILRRLVDGWCLAGITRRERVWTVRPDFLESGKSYAALWECDQQPRQAPFQPLPDTINIASRPLLAVERSGGFCLRLTPV